MTDSALSELISTLFLMVRIIAGYPEPESHPQVLFMPQAEIAEAICGQPCPVRAAYVRDTGILFDDTFDLENDEFARSVLLHELVHVLQDRDGAFADIPACLRQTVREREAYWAQQEYLYRKRQPVMAGLFNSMRFWPKCAIEP